MCLLLGLATIMGHAQKPWDNGRLVISSNNRYLQFENGRPFFWLGDTGWLVPQHLDRAEVEYYFNKCRRAGYNMVQIQVMDAVPSYNIYGQQSLPYGWDFTKADPEGVYSYWDHLDYIVRKAEQNGIYIGMVAIWGSQAQAGNINAEQAKAYGKFLAERYKNSPNIIWIMGGDIQGDIHPEVWNALATSIKSIDNKHLMTYHPRGRYTSAKWWSKASWMDFHTFQSGHRKYGQRMGNKDYPIPDSTEEDNWMYVDSTWAYKPIKPVLDDEPSYEDIPKGLHDANEARWQDYDVRRYAYWSVFAGSCGHTYGHNAIMQMLKPGYPTGYGSDGTVKAWYQALEDPGYNQMQYLIDLMLSFPYFDRIPDQSIIAGKNGVKYDRLIATRGKDYLMLYNYNSDVMKIDLRKISGKKKLLWWFNPSDGAISFIGTADNKIITVSPQIEKTDKINDRVLIAIDADKNYLSREQTEILNQRLADKKRNLNE
ncbi:glycoside hydrolase family 140 protein [Prevotella sp.]|uniref:glycoside hydrolase family 140 protein n=1 Tax=Prevotella sp. TaxID=59823 RepID=UPI0026497F1C|nr:glycoside hydrolase family 140 protein [Prevotella sp.]MDN5554220.1 glycoside hydrolase family 140 protein [Prevotella sp.]